MTFIVFIKRETNKHTINKSLTVGEIVVIFRDVSTAHFCASISESRVKFFDGVAKVFTVSRTVTNTKNSNFFAAQI